MKRSNMVNLLLRVVESNKNLSDIEIVDLCLKEAEKFGMAPPSYAKYIPKVEYYGMSKIFPDVVTGGYTRFVNEWELEKECLELYKTIEIGKK